MRSSGFSLEKLSWVLSNREPGCKVAAPSGTDSSSGQAYSFGTSDAAAQITHEAIKCYDTLMQIFLSETGMGVPDGYKAICLKAMLTHGASWESISDKLSTATQDSHKQLCKWIEMESLILVGFKAVRKKG